MSEERFLRKAPDTFGEYLANVGETKEAFMWVWRELVSSEGKRWALYMLGIMSITMLALMLQPLVFAWLINSIDNRMLQAVFFAAGMIVLLELTQKGSAMAHHLAREWVWNRNILQIQSRINELFYNKTLGQHLDEGSTLNYSNIERSKNRIQGVQEMLLFETGSILLTLLFSYVLLWYLSVAAGIAVTVLLVAYVTWAMYLNYCTAVETAPIEKAFRAQHRQLVERWEKVARVKTSGKSLSEYRRLRNWLAEILEEDRKFWFWFNYQATARDMLALIVRLGVMGYGAYLVYSGAEEIGFLMPLYIWITEVTRNLWYISNAERRLNEQVPYIKTLRAALTMEPHFDEHAGVPVSAKKPVSVRFKDVGLSYEGLSILQGVNFSVSPGEKVAIIGPSGAGKTTIMKLLLRFMDPTSGEIWINGHRLEDLRLSSLMEHVGYIPQGGQIFDGTIRYNLEFGLSEERKQTITDEEIWSVMELLQIDFGERLTHGLDTLVGRDGMKLSGGQAQRLMIGAAVIKKPIFMVIDEATSALDSSTEKLVQEGLQAVLTSEVGAVIVAHRLSTVREICDRFLVLRQIEEILPGENQVEADGRSFEELYEMSPTFRRLADDQGIIIDGARLSA